jgi:hypothetical protein
MDSAPIRPIRISAATANGLDSGASNRSIAASFSPSP